MKFLFASLFFTSFSLTLASPTPTTLVSPSSSSPGSHKFVPKLTSPNADTVWYKGEHRAARVTWDKTLVPSELVNWSNETVVKLGYRELLGDALGYPTWTEILTMNFKLGDGEVAVLLPESVPVCNQCVVGLAYGKTGIISPPFEIRDASECDGSTSEDTSCSFDALDAGRD